MTLVMISYFNSLHKASCLIYEKLQEDINNHIEQTDYLIPYIINGCFAIEIGLKALKKSCSNYCYSKDHILEELFNDFDELFQTEIKSKLKLPESRFKELLNVISKNYYDWRYFMGKDKISSNWFFIYTFSNILKETINKYSYLLN